MKEFINQLQSKDKEYKNLVRRHNILDYIRTILVRCFWPLYETYGYFSRVFTISFRLFYFGFVFLITRDFMTALIVYSAINLSLLIPVIVFENKTFYKIGEMVSQINEFRSMYEQEQLKLHSIFDDKITFEDGTVIGNGTFEKQLDRDFGDIYLYNFQNETDSSAYIDKTSFMPKHYMTLNKHIASEQFNKKFGIICRDDKMVETMSFFSPTKQLNMIQKGDCINNFKLIRIEGDRFVSETAFPVVPTRVMNLFDECPSFFFTEIDRYCAQMTQAAATLKDSFDRIGFVTN